MVFIDREMGRRGRATLLQHYRALIDASHLFADADATELEGHVHHAADQHATWAAQNYREHRRYSEMEFWRRRANAREASDEWAGNGGNRQAWRKGGHFAISEGVKTYDVPCVVGDFVELRPAVSHRTLSRPVALRSRPPSFLPR
jgi:hypothetical protein